MIRLTTIFLVISCFACKQEATPETIVANVNKEETAYTKAVNHPYKTFKGRTIDTRFVTPDGYTRKPVAENSFANYLRKLPLKTPGAPVKEYDGQVKASPVHAAVVDLPIGDKDLHQCADAVMRLWAEHHWLQKNYDKIHFNFTNGQRVDYNEWRKGRNMIVEGNKTYWDNSNSPREGYQSFWEYMELIFMYAGTKSLEKETKAISIEDMKIGDIFIQGGFPGHAVIIVDLATNESGHKVFLLAQSYMPAQEIHILKNENNDLSPWYAIPKNSILLTPEWEFQLSDLRRIVN